MFSLFTLGGQWVMSLHKFTKTRDWLSSHLARLPAPFSNFCIDTRPSLTLSYGFVLSHALRIDRKRGPSKISYLGCFAPESALS
jgi:hypothetical protein